MSRVLCNQGTVFITAFLLLFLIELLIRCIVFVLFLIDPIGAYWHQNCPQYPPDTPYIAQRRNRRRERVDLGWFSPMNPIAEQMDSLSNMRERTQTNGSTIGLIGQDSTKYRSDLPCGSHQSIKSRSCVNSIPQCSKTSTLCYRHIYFWYFINSDSSLWSLSYQVRRVMGGEGMGSQYDT